MADRDTLTSVAARFDTTPSELTKLNRLGTAYIFPGQHLYVPLRVKVCKIYTNLLCINVCNFFFKLHLFLITIINLLWIFLRNQIIAF